MAFKLALRILAAACVVASALSFSLHMSSLSAVKLPPLKDLAPAAPVTAYESKQDGPDIPTLLQQNKDWVASIKEQDPEYFINLAKGQTPRYLWIGCADSRCPAEAMMGAEPGQVFVQRNIANQVVTSDPNFMSMITYAVDYLKVEDIVVCGHYQCGGVAASSSDNDFGPALENWLINLREVFEVNQALVKGIRDPKEQQKRYVDINAKAQALKLIQHPLIKEAQKRQNGIPRIHTMVFDMENGVLKSLDVPEGAPATEAAAANENSTGMIPKFSTRLGKMLRKAAPVESKAAPVESSTDADFERLQKWLLHLGCPEYAKPIFNAGYRKFDFVQKTGFAESDLDGIVPPSEVGVRRLLTTAHHANYF